MHNNKYLVVLFLNSKNFPFNYLKVVRINQLHVITFPGLLLKAISNPFSFYLLAHIIK